MTRLNFFLIFLIYECVQIFLIWIVTLQEFLIFKFDYHFICVQWLCHWRRWL